MNGTRNAEGIGAKAVPQSRSARSVPLDVIERRREEEQEMKIHLISPEGQRVGPFKSLEMATAHATFCWPDKTAGCREEEPDVYEIEVEPKRRKRLNQINGVSDKRAEK